MIGEARCPLFLYAGDGFKLIAAAQNAILKLAFSKKNGIGVGIRHAVGERLCCADCIGVELRDPRGKLPRAGKRIGGHVRYDAQRLRFLACDAEGAVTEWTDLDLDGRPLMEPLQAPKATWEELQSHARFPAASADRARARW